jgi:hypothetical protein
MNDTQLLATWSALEPSARRRARMNAQVSAWLEAGETSLASEWLGVLKVAPFAALSCVGAGAAWLVLVTPVGWMTALILG